jgi:hypothetical protein
VETTNKTIAIIKAVFFMGYLSFLLAKILSAHHWTTSATLYLPRDSFGSPPVSQVRIVLNVIPNIVAICL